MQTTASHTHTYEKCAMCVDLFYSRGAFNVNSSTCHNNNSVHTHYTQWASRHQLWSVLEPFPMRSKGECDEIRSICIYMYTVYRKFIIACWRPGTNLEKTGEWRKKKSPLTWSIACDIFAYLMFKWEKLILIGRNLCVTAVPLHAPAHTRWTMMLECIWCWICIKCSAGPTYFLFRTTTIQRESVWQKCVQMKCLRITSVN